MDELLAGELSEWQRRRAMAIRLLALGRTNLDVAEIVGRHKNTIAKWRSAYLARGVEAITCTPGGRRHELMDEESEREFVASFLEAAERGEMVRASAFHAALSEHVGHDVWPSTVYRILERHGWRKVAEAVASEGRSGRARDVREHRLKVDLLMLIGAPRAARLLPDDRNERHMIFLRVVHAVHQVDGSWPRRGNAHSHLAAELGMRHSHQRGSLLVPCLHELESITGSTQCAEHAVDAIAGIPEQAMRPPRFQPIQRDVAHGFSHSRTLSRSDDAKPFRTDLSLSPAPLEYHIAFDAFQPRRSCHCNVRTAGVAGSRSRRSVRANSHDGSERAAREDRTVRQSSGSYRLLI